MKVKDLVISGVFLAILIICSWIIIPVGIIPVSMSIFAVFLIGAVLSPFNAMLVCAIYIVLGALGLPVFSGFGAGIAKIIGPTGGYIISYPFMAAIVAFSVKYGKMIQYYALGMSCALMLCYFFGAAYMVISLKITIQGALLSGVVPFILPDVAKIALASTIAYRFNAIQAKQKTRGTV